MAILRNGIPQDSPLGSLLFNIFLYGICDITQKMQLLLYADDLKYREVNNVNENKLLQKNSMDCFVSAQGIKLL